MWFACYINKKDNTQSRHKVTGLNWRYAVLRTVRAVVAHSKTTLNDVRSIDVYKVAENETETFVASASAMDLFILD